MPTKETEYKAKIESMFSEIEIKYQSEKGMSIESKNPDVQELLQLEIDSPDFMFGMYLPNNGGVRENYIADWIVKKYGGKVIQYAEIEEYEIDLDVVY